MLLPIPPDDGQLRKFDKSTNKLTDEPFQFEVSPNADINQKRYENLGEIITKYVYHLLIEMGLHKIYVPNDVPENQANFVFCTKPDLINVKQLIVIIHGSGVVRAGQWSRSLIINQSSNHGTQIPYIKRAIELGYDVLITNTNNIYNTDENGELVKLVGNATPVEHGFLVWQQLILPATGIERLVIVAHSYGGVVTLSLVKKFPEFFKEKCMAVCFTDSVHSTASLSNDLIRFLQKVRGNCPLRVFFIHIYSLKQFYFRFSDWSQLGNVIKDFGYSTIKRHRRYSTIFSRSC